MDNYVTLFQEARLSRGGNYLYKKTLFWILSVCSFLIWCVISNLYSEPIDWWSIYSANHSTTDPYYPMISWTKITYIILICLGFSYAVTRGISSFIHNIINRR